MNSVDLVTLLLGTLRAHALGSAESRRRRARPLPWHAMPCTCGFTKRQNWCPTCQRFKRAACSASRPVSGDDTAMVDVSDAELLRTARAWWSRQLVRHQRLTGAHWPMHAAWMHECLLREVHERLASASREEPNE
jgi:hypothetical protein